MANKEELKKFHQQAILATAKTLFAQKGVAQTTMDDIAKASQYSKSTLYVYFESKEEVFQHLVYEFHITLRNMLAEVMGRYSSTRDCFLAFCKTTTRFQQENPFYFEAAMSNIKKGEEEIRKYPILKEIMTVNQEIHELVGAFLKRGMSRGEVRPELELDITAFSLWASIYGIISMTYQRGEYLHRFYRMDTDEYLQRSFDLLLHSISV